MEQDITEQQARALITAPGFDAYGRTRIYGQVAAGHESAGQLVGIKSLYYLERHTYSRLYTVTNTGGVPIRRA